MRVFVHPLFILTALVAIFFATTGFFISLTVAVISHEFAHAIIAKHYGVVASHLTLTPFGGTLNLSTKVLSTRQKSLVYLAGPVASLLLSMLFGVLVWLFPIAFHYLEYLVAANFLVGIINLFPIYPLDGGKILSQHLSAEKVLIFSNIIFSVVLTLSLIFFNWWWVFFAVIMIIQINWDFKKMNYFDKFSYRGSQKTGQIVRCAVLSTNTLFTAYRMVNKKHPTEFIITDQNNHIFYEKDLEEWLIKYDLDTKIARCISR